MPSLDKTAVQLLIPGRFTLIIWMKSNLKDNSEILQKRNPLSVRWENRYKGGTGDFSAVAGQNVVFWGGEGGGTGQLGRAKPRGIGEKHGKFLKFSFLKLLQIHQSLETSSDIW